MDDPVYRIVTLCPSGMSSALKDFLEMPADDDGMLMMRDIIAINLLKPYGDTSLPFCCTFLGWASSEYPARELEEALSLLNNLKVANGDNIISTEGFSQTLDNGRIQLVGAYPLLDIPEPTRSKEYKKVSFIINKKATDKIFEWSYRTLLRGALDSDIFGIVIAVQANNDSLADEKIHEAVALLGNR